MVRFNSPSQELFTTVSGPVIKSMEWAPCQAPTTISTMVNGNRANNMEKELESMMIKAIMKAILIRVIGVAKAK